MTTPTFTLELGSHKLRCEYHYSPATPGVWTLPNGDPGFPGDPEEYWVEKVELRAGAGWLDITGLLDAFGVFDEESLLDEALLAEIARGDDEPPENPDDLPW